MIQNKKGLSAIITTLLVVVLVLVAVGIVWGVVSGLLKSGAEDIELSAKCLSIEVTAVSADCSAPAACSVVVERTGSSTDEIAGIKVVIKDSSTGAGTAVEDVVGNIETLETETIIIDASALTTQDSVEVTAYFTDTSGDEQLCSQKSSFTF